MQEFDRRLCQRGGEPEEDPGHGAVDGSLHHEPSTPTDDEEGDADDGEHGDRDRPFVAGRVLAPSGRVPEEGKQRQADDDDPGSDHLTPPDVLLGEEVAEGEGEHDRHDEQRLDDRQTSSIERRRLERIAHEQRCCAEEPHRLPDEPRQRRGMPKRDGAEVERALLLQRRRERKQEGSDESEDGGHRRRLGRGPLSRNPAPRPSSAGMPRASYRP